jgi:hypothetical protein
MTDLAQEQPAVSGAVNPSPSSIRPRPVAVAAGNGRSVAAERATAADSRRAAARAALDAALRGVELTSSDRRFLARLSQWDKRNAIAVASLVMRAKQTGQAEAGLSPAQLDTLLAALLDAFAYRTSGAAATGCWDCANRPSGLCADHAKDAVRARAFADLATVLSALSGEAAPAHLECLAAMPAFRQRTPVAS